MSATNKRLGEAHGFICIQFLVPSAVGSNQSSNVVTYTHFFLTFEPRLLTTCDTEKLRKLTDSQNSNAPVTQPVLEF
jgi:hypothetical protein